MTMVLLLAVGYPLGFALGLIFALVSTAATKLFYLWGDHESAPLRRGGRRVDERDEPDLVASLRELAHRAEIPVPNLYVIDSWNFNALATGRGHRHAAICVTHAGNCTPGGGERLVGSWVTTDGPVRV